LGQSEQLILTCQPQRVSLTLQRCKLRRATPCGFCATPRSGAAAQLAVVLTPQTLSQLPITSSLIEKRTAQPSVALERSIMRLISGDRHRKPFPIIFL
jgi:hypothetical protein